MYSPTASQIKAVREARKQRRRLWRQQRLSELRRQRAYHLDQLNIIERELADLKRLEKYSL